jgi:hypothetical protein
MAYSKEELIRINFVKSFGLAGTIIARMDNNDKDDNIIAYEVLALAKALNIAVDHGLDQLGVLEAGASETASAPVSAANEACPTCEQEGRNGVLVPKEGSGRGPKYTCSLRERQKFGDEYRDVGECDYVRWN